MTTDLPARVAELEAQNAKMRRALEKCRPWIKDQILMGTDYQAVACQECVREIDAALTGTGDDVLADCWQPIATAPRDQSEFQAWVQPDDKRRKGFWEPRCRFNSEGGFEIWGRSDYDQDDWLNDLLVTPTLWMRQPGAPRLATPTEGR